MCGFFTDLFNRFLSLFNNNTNVTNDTNSTNIVTSNKKEEIPIHLEDKEKIPKDLEISDSDLNDTSSSYKISEESDTDGELKMDNSTISPSSVLNNDKV